MSLLGLAGLAVARAETVDNPVDVKSVDLVFPGHLSQVAGKDVPKPGIVAEDCPPEAPVAGLLLAVERALLPVVVPVLQALNRAGRNIGATLHAMLAAGVGEFPAEVAVAQHRVLGDELGFMVRVELRAEVHEHGGRAALLGVLHPRLGLQVRGALGVPKVAEDLTKFVVQIGLPDVHR
jgi:hypothetical protein